MFFSEMHCYDQHCICEDTKGIFSIPLTNAQIKFILFLLIYNATFVTFPKVWLNFYRLITGAFLKIPHSIFY